jgi:hypothetical protein
METVCTLQIGIKCLEIQMSRFSRYYSEGSKRLSIVRSGYCFSFATSANRMDGQNIWPTDEGCM